MRRLPIKNLNTTESLTKNFLDTFCNTETNSTYKLLRIIESAAGLEQ